MAVDPRYGNSSGYFKDPTNDEDLSVDTPRAVPCSFEDGKFTWPRVLSSDGEQLLKIVYKLFTPEEKDLYNAYRGRPTGTSERKPRSTSGTRPKIQKEQEAESEEPVQVVKHSDESVATLKTLETLAQCDRIYGVSQIAGITYVLCGSYGSNVVHHIPRSIVPDDEFDRLMGGTA